MSEEQPFRRKFSSIFDTLLQCEFDFEHLINSLHLHQPANSERIAGYEVYAVDSTPNERPEAETLEDRGSLKTQKDEPLRYGHKYSWLARLLHWGSSWVALAGPGLNANQSTKTVSTGHWMWLCALAFW
ncbi:MAG TPA: hypothetical protein VLH85_09385 [Levilinea sp.]|nr:hypothetical protein [Levilinea sp.]